MGREQEPRKVLKNILSHEDKVSRLSVCEEAAEGLFSHVEPEHKCDFKIFPKTLKKAIIPPVR